MPEDSRQPTTPFTLVVSDVHAFPEFLENALRRSGFRAGVDHLVFAGDLLDRGGQPGACLERLDALGAEMLIGDHDHATMLGYFIGEQSPASRGYRRALLRRFSSGALSLVTAVDGVLISHAGLSRAFAADFAAVGRDPVRLAQLVNEEFCRDLGRQLSVGMQQPEPRTLDGHSPMWLRVDDPDVGPQRLLDGIEQIAGHTTPSVFRHWTEGDFVPPACISSTRAATASARATTRATTATGWSEAARCRSRPAHPMRQQQAAGSRPSLPSPVSPAPAPTHASGLRNG